MLTLIYLFTYVLQSIVCNMKNEIAHFGLKKNFEAVLRLKKVQAFALITASNFLFI